MTTFEIPVIVTVTVDVMDDGDTRVRGARPDIEGGPWAFSTEPAAYDTDTGDWHECGRFDGSEPFERAAMAAYGYMEGLPLFEEESDCEHPDGSLITVMAASGDEWLCGECGDTVYPEDAQ